MKHVPLHDARWQSLARALSSSFRRHSARKCAACRLSGTNIRVSYAAGSSRVRESICSTLASSSVLRDWLDSARANPSRISSEEERFLECPICLLPMDNIVFLGTMPDNPSQKETGCRHGFCKPCVLRGIEKDAKSGKLPSCAICRREIVSVIDCYDTVGRLVQEYHKAQEAKKEADGWRGIIATLNGQLKKAREEAKAVGAAPAVDPERLATAEREKGVLQEEVAKLLAEMAQMQHTIEASEAQQREKEELAKRTIVELRATKEKECEDLRARVEEVKEACARQLLAKDRQAQLRFDELGSSHANEINRLKQEMNAMRGLVAQQEAAKNVQQQVDALKLEQEAIRKTLQIVSEEKAALQASVRSANASLAQMNSQNDELVQRVEAEKQASRALEAKFAQQQKERADAHEAELKKLKEHNGMLNATLAKTKQALTEATEEADAKSKEREAELRRRIDQLHAEKVIIEGKLTSLSRRADQVAAVERKAEEAQMAEGALRQQLIDKSNQIFSLEQHNAALQTHIKELKGRIARMDSGSSSRILAPSSTSSSTANLSASVTHGSPTLNNSYLGMLSSSLTNSVASVSSSPLSSWFGGSATRSRGFIKTAADYHKFSSQEKHSSLTRFAFPTCRGQDIAGGGHVFMCRVRVSKSVPSTALYREMMYTATLRHQNIIRLDGVVREKLTENDFLLELGLAPFVEESMEDAIRALRFSPSDVRSIFHQILSLVHYLHSASLVLRSFNPSQLLFSPRECVVKLGVLSTVRSLHSQPFDPPPPSALYYIAPELLYTSATSPQTNWRAADCWSVGCILAEILLGRPLFDGCKDSVAILRRALSIPSLRPRALDDVVTAQLPVLTAAADSFSYLTPLPSVQLVEVLSDAGAGEIDLIAKLLCLVPQYRITIKQALEHACFPAGQYVGAVESGLGAELADDQILKWVENVALFK